MNAEPRTPPGPGFVAGCTSATWLDVTPAGQTAWLLIGHAPPRRLNETSESIGARLLALADNLGLRAAADRVPHIGRRLLIRHGVVACDYGHDDYLMRVPDTGQAWQQHVIRGGQVLLVVGLDPLPPYQGQQEVDAYLRQATNRHHVLMGATGAR